MDPIAQSIASALAGSGVLGVVVWVLIKEIVPALRSLTSAIRYMEAAHDRNAEATSLRIIAAPHIIPEVKERAAQILESTRAASEERRHRDDNPSS